MTGDHRVVADLDIRVRQLARAHAINKVVAVESDAVVARLGAATNGRRVLPDHAVIRVRPDDLLRVGRLFGVVWKAELAAYGRGGERRFDVHRPVSDVDHMRAP